MLLHNRYLSYISFAGVVSWLAFAMVVFKLNPTESTSLALILFFVSLFFALTATFTVVGYFFRLWLNRNEIFYNHLNISLRQGILLSIIALGCLGLQMLKILNWWLGALLIAAVTLVEFYIASNEG